MRENLILNCHSLPIYVGLRLQLPVISLLAASQWLFSSYILLNLHLAVFFSMPVVLLSFLSFLLKHFFLENGHVIVRLAFKVSFQMTVEVCLRLTTSLAV